MDADLVFGDDVRAVQLTPPHSPCSIAFGKGLTTAEPGSAQHLELAVYDIDAAREDLIHGGVEVSEVFHRDGGRVFPGPTRNVAPTSRMPRSAIQMATGGCSRRSRRGFRAGSGRSDDGRRFPSRAPA
jgi:shikimate kinase